MGRVRPGYRGSRADDRVSELIADDGPLATTELVMMEVMAGARTDVGKEDLRRLLLRFHLLPFNAAADFTAAARIYRLCRRVGVTPRGLIDCMTASVARRNNATLLTHDADLTRVRVAQVVGIAMDPASLTLEM